MYLEKAKQREEDMHRVGDSQFMPCTVEEIENLEIWLGQSLPKAYQEFLLWMGHSGGGFLQGSDCFYQDLRNLQSSAQELLNEDQFAGTLPENTFVFFMHQGYQFKFFCIGEGEDPPIFSYVEEEPVRTFFYQAYAHFSDFLLDMIEYHIKTKKMIESNELRRKQTKNKFIAKSTNNYQKLGNQDQLTEGG